MIDFSYKQQVDQESKKYTNDFGIFLTKENLNFYINKFISDSKNTKSLSYR